MNFIFASQKYENKFGFQDSTYFIGVFGIICKNLKTNAI